MSIIGPKIKEREPKEFDEQLYKEELDWLTRIKEEKVKVSTTPAEIYPALFSASVAAFFIGLTVGATLSAFSASIIWLLILPVVIFIITFYLALKPYSIIAFDLHRNIFQYKGLIQFAGDEHNSNFRGPIEVIEGTQVIRHKRFKKIFIRFITNSGYMRMNYHPTQDNQILARLEELDLINLQEVEQALDQQVIISHSNSFYVVYEKKFDRSDFKQEMAAKKKEEDRIKAEHQAEKKRLLLEKSKQKKEKK
ncbi:MAG: hypothetical protein INQ03_05830 [Candidatus Heimdallarchaeota archaeon]|nr:hypothetical protein [Candidatus Heimdallarchaeota archaeon]